MPLPGSPRDRKRAFLQEINEVQGSNPEFLQEIKEPVHEEVLSEQPKKRSRKKK